MEEGFNYDSQLRGGNARYVHTNIDKHITCICSILPSDSIRMVRYSQLLLKR
jgi:hypothetical protein